jgi:hypothetical protein
LAVLRRTERKPSKFITKLTHARVRAGTLAKFTLRREPISVAYYSAKKLAALARINHAECDTLRNRFAHRRA